MKKIWKVQAKINSRVDPKTIHHFQGSRWINVILVKRIWFFLNLDCEPGSSNFVRTVSWKLFMLLFIFVLPSWLTLYQYKQTTKISRVSNTLFTKHYLDSLNTIDSVYLNQKSTYFGHISRIRLHIYIITTIQFICFFSSSSSRKHLNEKRI